MVSKITGMTCEHRGFMDDCATEEQISRASNLMTGQIEICITLGEVWVTSFSVAESPMASIKPPNFLSLGSEQEFPVVIELSVSFVREGFHLLIGESSQSRLPNLTIQHSSPAIVVIIVL
ncbi:hypothetical protein K0M31_001556 [Melipona bicolor]|uniref:Uncharacterized protein n=1 Tax=Melipona bicolor TaxID=60889 RepID=A0AA40KXY0_9HYME|nr:hypothetical protein K0M31_001556 [Melipona bicolor]